MIRLNGSRASTLRRSQAWNVPWFSRPVRSSVWARISTARWTSAFWSGDRDLGREQRDQLELVHRVAVLEAEALEREHAGRALAAHAAGRRSGCRPWRRPGSG